MSAINEAIERIRLYEDVMSIFRDRIVLKDGTVIMPEQIRSLSQLGGEHQVVVYYVPTGETEPYARSFPINDIRTDRPTGMVDSTGKVIFERDIVCSTDGDRGTVAMWRGRWIVRFHTPNLENIPLYEIDKSLTITGMVPWEDGR